MKTTDSFPHQGMVGLTSCHVTHRAVHCLIIESFRDDWLRSFFVGDKRAKRIPADLEQHLFRKLQLIDDASTDADLRAPPSNHFEKLSGNLDGWHSIRVNQQ